MKNSLSSEREQSRRTENPELSKTVYDLRISEVLGSCHKESITVVVPSLQRPFCCSVSEHQRTRREKTEGERERDEVYSNNFSLRLQQPCPFPRCSPQTVKAEIVGEDFGLYLQTEFSHKRLKPLPI